MLLYPLYAVYFADAGLTPAAVSLLFVIWSATSVFEVPSGVLADVFSRRWLVAAGPVFTAAGFAAWTFFPSFAVFAVGFVLWGLGTALRSGALQALVFEELARLGARGSYARLMGRAQAAGTTAVLIATAVAAPVLDAGGYRAVGVCSVVVCLLGAVVSLSLPEHRGVGHDEDEEPSFRKVLTEGWAQVRGERRVRVALVVSMAVMGTTALDEYIPYLAQSTGVAVAAVPLLVLVVSAGDAAGGWMAGRGDARWLGPAMVAAGACLAAGALTGRPEGLVLVAVAFGLFQWAIAAADARLQERISDRVRATVTSLAGLGSETLAVLIFAGYALGSVWAGPGVLFAVAAVPCALMGAALMASARRSPHQ